MTARLLAVLTTVLLSTSLAAAQMAAQMAAQTTAPADSTMPPGGQHVVLTALGRGVQIYACRASESDHAATSNPATAKPAEKQYQWVFVAPAARLFLAIDGQEQEIGSHGDGPVWIDHDGSSVHGQVVAKQASPDSGSIPWLLLKAVAPTGKGVLTTVDYIRRSDTKGGVAPGDGCNPGHLGDLSRVPYTAAYTFYEAG